MIKFPSDNIAKFTGLQQPTKPSIAVADDLSTHVVWQEDGKIYYRSRSSEGSWGDVENVRVSSYYTETPTIATYTDDRGDLTIHVAWVEWYAPGTGGGDIVKTFSLMSKMFGLPPVRLMIQAICQLLPELMFSIIILRKKRKCIGCVKWIILIMAFHGKFV